MLALSFVVIKSEHEMIVAGARTLRVWLDVVSALNSCWQWIGLAKEILKVRQSYHYCADIIRGTSLHRCS